MTAAIFTSNLKKSYGQKEVLKGITLTVDPGTICALLGTNGAGKTTMVRILTTQIVPDAGQAAIMGHDVERDAGQIHQIIGLTGQFSALDDACALFCVEVPYRNTMEFMDYLRKNPQIVIS